MAELTMVEAVRAALDHAMNENDRVIVLGEDVGVDGGVFRATDGLLADHGEERVIDMPLSEALFAGLAVGLGSQGFRPVVEYQFMGFMAPAIDQVMAHASRLRNRTRGRLSCPIVLRAPFGGGIHAPEHHSESFEAMFAHIPGIRVVIPSSPKRAYGLLLSAIRDPDPVIFLEPKRIYRSVEEEIGNENDGLPLDRCFELQKGEDLTLISWGAMIDTVIEAAAALSNEGLSVSVIDVATLKPLDIETILASLETTGRAVIVHEAPMSGGWGAEIAAQIADHGLTHLLAPVKRVTGFDTVMPLPKLEQLYIPQVDRVLSAARKVLEYR